MLGRTLYFPDGSHECIYGRDDQEIKDCFSGIVEMRCGHEAAQLFQELVSSPKKENSGDNYELISDGYYQMLTSTVDELDAVLETLKEGKRINRDKLYTSIRNIRNQINHNI